MKHPGMINKVYNVSDEIFNWSEDSFKRASEIIKNIPSFTIAYKPDFRQQIANSWPNSIDDTAARQDWNWKHSYDISMISQNMLQQLEKSERLNVL